MSRWLNLPSICNNVIAVSARHERAELGETLFKAYRGSSAGRRPRHPREYFVHRARQQGRETVILNGNRDIVKQPEQP